jgi:hypothetical protein
MDERYDFEPTVPLYARLALPLILAVSLGSALIMLWEGSGLVESAVWSVLLLSLLWLRLGIRLPRRYTVTPQGVRIQMGILASSEFPFGGGLEILAGVRPSGKRVLRAPLAKEGRLTINLKKAGGWAYDSAVISVGNSDGFIRLVRTMRDRWDRSLKFREALRQ